MAANFSEDSQSSDIFENSAKTRRTPPQTSKFYIADSETETEGNKTQELVNTFSSKLHQSMTKDDFKNQLKSGH